jgi:hypothetical protein
MGIFNKKKVGEDHRDFDVTVTVPSSEATSTPTIESKTEPGKMIWVSGYKGTDNNMQCRGYQFSFDTEHRYEGNIELCERGFHLCLYLPSVFYYYTLDDSNRYFEVLALVKESDYLIAKQNGDSKIVAVNIKFIRELTFEEKLPFIKKQYSFIDTEEEWNSLLWSSYHSPNRTEFWNNYHHLCKSKFTYAMNDLGFGQLFNRILADRGRNLTDTLNLAKALKAENISHDYVIYELLKATQSSK